MVNAGTRAEQACRKAAQRAQRSRNARRVSAQVWADVVFYLGLQWSPEQIAQKVAVSHESVYLRVYADKAAGGHLHKNLRSQVGRFVLGVSPLRCGGSSAAVRRVVQLVARDAGDVLLPDALPI